MTGVFHQEMFNFILKPQYRRQLNLWDEIGIALPESIIVNAVKHVADFKFDKDACLYDHIYVYYGSETGRGLRMATLLISDFGSSATGPIPLDSLPDLLKENVEKPSLVVVVTSTLGSGRAPFTAKNYVDSMRKVPNNSVQNIDFAVLALGNSAYTENFATFAQKVEKSLKKAGCNPAMGMQIADDLKDPEASFGDFRKMLLDEAAGTLYKSAEQGMDPEPPNEAQLVTMTFEGCIPVLQRQTVEVLGTDAWRTESIHDSWESHSHKLGRSLDLFRFKMVGSNNENLLQALGSGDHIALYPTNMNDVVESVLRHVEVDDKAAAREYLKEYKDLSKPLGASEIFILSKLIQSDQHATEILDVILSNGAGSTYPSIERLVQVLPPGSVPMQWILTHAPSMDPRFYSIASLDKRQKAVSIVQSVYSFDATQKAGVTSRWLRSLSRGDKATATFTTTNFLPPQEDEGSPILLISTGSGIAPCRTFWLSGRKNPTYLFCGCRSPEELPFATEIELLEKKGLLHPYIAYSRVKEGKMRLEAKMKQERRVLLELLHNPKTRIYLCGSPELESTVRNTLVTILAQGDGYCRGLGMARSMERLALMDQSKRFVREVYGSATGDSKQSDPMLALWQESTTKVIRSLAGLEKLGVPIPPSPRRSTGGSDRANNEEKRPTFSYNPKISGA
jgi:sulfite reductase (NADPH) flavoprotein alpha-component